MPGTKCNINNCACQHLFKIAVHADFSYYLYQMSLHYFRHSAITPSARIRNELLHIYQHSLWAERSINNNASSMMQRTLKSYDGGKTRR
jgi:hypothetical protein